MRKVYHNEQNRLSVIVSVLFSLGLTAALFAALPFAHRMAKSDRVVDLVKTSTVELPPVDEPEPPPTPEREEQEEPLPEPDLAQPLQQIPLSADIEVVMGEGGGLVGYGDTRALTAATAIAEETFDVSELEKRPEPVSQGPPAYPADMRKAKIGGVVTLVFVLNEEGRVEDARVENSTRPEFEKPALEAVRKWRFRPGVKDGQNVRTYIRSPVRFSPPTG
jgi:periplasmic protein TonB